MKKFLSCIAVLSLLATQAYGGKRSFGANLGQASMKVAVTYEDSQVDTLVVNREAGLSALALGVYFADSASVTNAIVRRVINGVAAPVIAGDTLTTYNSLALTAAGSRTQAITLAPLCDTYWVVVTFAGSANGVTTPTVTYEFQKAFSR